LRGYAAKRSDLRGFARIFMDGSGEARRGGAEGPGAASGTGHTQHKATDLPARVTLPHNQGRKVDGPSLAIYPQPRRGPALKS